MIYVTGDKHGTIDFGALSTKRFPEQKNMTREDYVIICGDMGIVFNQNNEDRWIQKWYEAKRFTTLFVDGNHENHQALSRYPVKLWNGGKAHCISEHILHLMRGQVFDIDGTTIFTFGGADSHDKEFRKEGKNWWAEELPSNEDYAEAAKNLRKADYRVDYIITHCCGSDRQFDIAPQYTFNHLTEYLQRIDEVVTYRRWYFGHFHKNMDVDQQHTVLYDRIIPIGAAIKNNLNE